MRCFVNQEESYNDLRSKNSLATLQIVQVLGVFRLSYSETTITYIYSTKVSIGTGQRYTYRVLKTTQMKLIQICVWAEQAGLGSAKTALKFKYEI